MQEVIFIAGPMTGRRNFNFDAFRTAARVLRSKLDPDEYRVIDPSQNHGGRQDLMWEDYLEESLRQVKTEATIVCVLDGWMESRGAKLEIDEAMRKQIPIMAYESMTHEASPINEPDPTCIAETASSNRSPLGSDQLLEREGFEVSSDPLEDRTLETPIPMARSAAGLPPAPTISKAEAFAKENSEWLARPYVRGDMLGKPIENRVEERPVVDRAWNMVVEGDRQAAYGHPNSDFTAMGRISAAILSRWLESEGLRVERVPEASKREVVFFPDIPPRIATMLMQSVKLSREAAKPNQDNRDDSVGYMICTDRSVKAGTPDEY